MSTVRPALQGHLLFFGQMPDAVCSTGFAVLRTKRNDGDPRFLFAHLFGDGVAAQVESLLAGSNYPAINSGDVGGLRVTCPPSLVEQRAIANVLSDMDDEIAALDRRLAKTRAIKQGMMQQLLTGSIRLPIPDDGLEVESHDA
jgi:type I restriction enzyme S subunit